MAAPKPARITTPKVNKATGFTTGTVKTNKVAAKPVTTTTNVTTQKYATPAAQKKAAGVQSAKAFTPAAAAKSQSPLDAIGSFINNRVGQMTGKIATPISGAMRNPTPVIPYTQRNVEAIKKATRKP